MKREHPRANSGSWSDSSSSSSVRRASPPPKRRNVDGGIERQSETHLPTPPPSERGQSPPSEIHPTSYCDLFSPNLSPYLAANGVVRLDPNHTYEELPAFQAYLAILGSPSVYYVPWTDTADQATINAAVRRGVEYLLETKSRGKGWFPEPSDAPVHKDFRGLPWLSCHPDAGNTLVAFEVMKKSVHPMSEYTFFPIYEARHPFPVLLSSVYVPPALPGEWPGVLDINSRTSTWISYVVSLYSTDRHPINTLQQYSPPEERYLWSDDAWEDGSEDDMSVDRNNDKDTTEDDRPPVEMESDDDVTQAQASQQEAIDGPWSIILRDRDRENLVPGIHFLPITCFYSPKGHHLECRFPSTGVAVC